MKNENNTITEVGQVITRPEYSHEHFGERFYSFKLLVTRTSGDFDVIPCTISERICDPTENDIYEKYFSITGSIRTYNEHTEHKLIIFLFVDEMYEITKEADTYDNNKVELVGYICKKSSARPTPFGRTIIDTILAVNRNYNKSDYIPVIFWNKNAKYIDTLPIGTKLKISGRFQSREYLKNEDIHMVYEVSVQSVEILVNEKSSL